MCCLLFFFNSRVVLFSVWHCTVQAKAGNTNVFQQGKVALQGFTVVFGVFVVPIPTATKYLRLDDSDQNCRQHMSRKLERAEIQKNYPGTCR